MPERPKRVFSLPKLAYAPSVKENVGSPMMDSRLFLAKPSRPLLQKMKVNNFMSGDKKRLVL